MEGQGRDFTWMPRMEIEAENKRLVERIAALEKCVFSNGRPGLEERMKEYVDSRTLSARTHAEKNAAESDGYLLRQMERLEKETEKRHEDNREEAGDFRNRIEALDKKQAMYSGGLAMLVVAVNILMKVWK